jgi:hypothetical protein
VLNIYIYIYIYMILIASRLIIQPLSCERGENGELLIMPANSRWDLIRVLKG